MRPATRPRKRCWYQGRAGTVVEKNATAVVDNQPALVSLSKGLDGINQGNNDCSSWRSRRRRRSAAGGGTLREVDFINQLAVLSQRIAKNANSLVSSDEIDPEVAFLLGKDAGSFPRRPERPAKGQRPSAPVRPQDRRRARDADRTAEALRPYEAGVNAILQNMQRLVVAKARCARINQESEPLLGETTKLTAEFDSQTAARGFTLGASMLFAVVALLCLIAVRQGFPRRRACPRLRERAREQAQPGGDFSPAERDGQSRRRRPDCPGVSDRGRHRRHRRLDQLHYRGVAHAGARHQLGDRPGGQGDAPTRRPSPTACTRRRSARTAKSSRLPPRCCRWRNRSTKCPQTAAQSARVAQQSLAAAEKGGQAVHNQIAGMNEIRSRRSRTLPSASSGSANPRWKSAKSSS